MLSFHLDARDMSAGWRTTPAGLATGASHIEPYRHPALEDFAVAADGRLLVCVRERCATWPNAPALPGAGRLTVVSPERWEQVRERLCDWPLQSYLLEIRRDDAGVHAAVRAGSWSTAPVFLLGGARELWGDWDPARLYPQLGGAKLDLSLAARFLTQLYTPYSRRTLFADMQMLTERARARWRPAPGGVHAHGGVRAHGGGRALVVDYPEPTDWPLPGTLKPDADAPGAFWEIVGESLARWMPPDEDALGAELSGGLDSAIVAAAAADLLDRPLASYGIALSGGCASDQRARRGELIGRFGLCDAEVDIADWLPLAPSGGRGTRGAVVPWEECYYEAADALLERAVARGTSTLLTGLGGDELCSLRSWEPRERSAADIADRAARAPAFLCDAAREAFESDDACDRAPRAATHASSVETVALSSSMYMRRGVWAVHPLCTPELARFCARLPREWRAQRRVQRRLLTRLGCSARVTSPAVADDFLPALVSGLRTSAREPLTRLFAESELAERGLVDRDRLLREFADWCEGGEDEDVVPFYAAAVLELALAAHDAGV